MEDRDGEAAVSAEDVSMVDAKDTAADDLRPAEAEAAPAEKVEPADPEVSPERWQRSRRRLHRKQPGLQTW